MVRTSLWTLSGMLLMALAAELLCRLLPVSTSTATGYHFDADILTYPAHHEWRVATGWDLRNPQTLRSNNAGFATHRDFTAGLDPVVLIGDSYVESSMLAPSDRPAAQLEALLGGKRPVFGMGSPGTSLLDHAERIRFAAQRYGAREFVVFIEGGDLAQSVCGSGAIHSACLDDTTLAPSRRRLPAPSLAKQALRESAFAQYLVGQLRLDPQAVIARLTVAAPASQPAADSVQRERIARAATTAFFERVREVAPGARLLLLVDGRHIDLEQPAPVVDAAERHAFMEAARAQGAVVVDAETHYAAHYRRSPLSLNVGPYDGHLNVLGVRVLMAAAAERLH